jgi:hypothetical protein
VKPTVKIERNVKFPQWPSNECGPWEKVSHNFSLKFYMGGIDSLFGYCWSWWERIHALEICLCQSLVDGGMV